MNFGGGRLNSQARTAPGRSSRRMTSRPTVAMRNFVAHHQRMKPFIHFDDISESITIELIPPDDPNVAAVVFRKRTAYQCVGAHALNVGLPRQVDAKQPSIGMTEAGWRFLCK